MSPPRLSRTVLGVVDVTREIYAEICSCGAVLSPADQPDVAFPYRRRLDANERGSCGGCAATFSQSTTISVLTGAFGGTLTLQTFSDEGRVLKWSPTASYAMGLEPSCISISCMALNPCVIRNRLPDQAGNAENPAFHLRYGTFRRRQVRLQERGQAAVPIGA
jgi:hypothetical protein